MQKIKYKKKLGQNFLQNQTILNKIAAEIPLNNGDLIIEIGPGSGNLTKCLQKSGSQIIAYEIDLSLKDRLKVLENKKTEVIYDDFLARDISKDLEGKVYNNLYVVANIPYYITTPILTKLIESKLNIKQIVIMVQKEVAERLSANPGTRDYGYFTVLLNYFFDIQSLFFVSRKNFYPQPNVDSTVIKLIPKIQDYVDLTKFTVFSKAAFQHKRKTLKNNLKDFNLEKINIILTKYGYSLNNRAEEIPCNIFVDIVNQL